MSSTAKAYNNCKPHSTETMWLPLLLCIISFAPHKKRNPVLPGNKLLYLKRRITMWSIADSNRSPRHCQCRALARWANTPLMRCKDKTIFTTVQNIEKFFYLHDRPRQQAFGRSQINLAPAPIFFTFVKRIIWFSEQQDNPIPLWLYSTPHTTPITLGKMNL